MNRILACVALGLSFTVAPASAQQARPADETSVVPKDRLPVLGTVGDLPPAAERVTISLGTKPGFTFDGWTHDLAGLRKYLKIVASAAREEDGPKCSRFSVVIRADRFSRWKDVFDVLRECAAPEVRIYKVLFSAVSSKDGSEGALALYLPRESGLQGFPKGRVRTTFSIAFDSGGFADGGIMESLFGVWNKARGASGGTWDCSTIEADSGVSTSAVLEAADAALRLKAGNVYFIEPREARIRRPVPNPLPRILVMGDPAGTPAKDARIPPPPDRVQGGLAGQCGAFTTPPEVPLTPPTSPPGPVVPEPEPGAIGIGLGAGGLFGGRRGEKREIDSVGGAGTEAAVLAGLDWLARHQAPDGSWDGDGFGARCQGEKCDGPGGPGHDAGLTGLALLAFLGYGETHKTPKYGHVVRNALKRLNNFQDSTGCFGAREPAGCTYDNAVPALAMIEAYGLTQSPLFKENAQYAATFLLRRRSPGLAWRCGVRPGDNDTSVTGWTVMALRAAVSAGLDVDPAAFVGTEAWLDKVTDPGTGRAGLTAPGTGPFRTKETAERFPADRSESPTAIAVLARIWCRAPAESPLVDKGIALCVARPPVFDEKGGSTDFYYWHFGTLAMYQVGGDSWNAWNEAMKKALLGSQRMAEGEDRRGSWDPVDPWGAEGGRVYATAINTLTLETYYRYAKIRPGK